jgi:hypothetical protein
MRPGAIRCGRDHNHIYFPRDFQFKSSPVAISDAVMLQNRDAYRAINSSGQRSSHDYEPEPVKPPVHLESGLPGGQAGQ